MAAGPAPRLASASTLPSEDHPPPRLLPSLLVTPPRASVVPQAGRFAASPPLVVCDLRFVGFAAIGVLRILALRSADSLTKTGQDI